MGELARKPGCPELAKTPLELLTPRPGEGYSMFEKWCLPVLGGLSTYFVLAKFNRYFGTPIWAGAPAKIIITLAMTYELISYRDSVFAARAETDSILKHYITLHPDDFPPYDRKRWKDVYRPFNPIR